MATINIKEEKRFHMSIEVGAKVTGKVSGITNFGAFVDLGDHKTGLVHISEVSDGFVKDIHDVLTVGDEVTVKVLSVGDDGKIGLSIRKAQAKPHADKGAKKPYHNNHHGDNNHHDFKKKSANPRQRRENNNHRRFDAKNKDFDSMLAGFLKESEDRLTSLKRNTEGKRGGRGGRRS